MVHFCNKYSKIINTGTLYDIYGIGGVYIMGQIIVGIADMKVGSGSDELVTYALGSCIGVCMYDEIVQAGGMLHAMLPKSGMHTELANSYKYVDTGIIQLYRLLCRRGAGIGRIKAKIIGGARMFEFGMSATSGMAADIGTLNIRETKKYLLKLGVPITAEMTGGSTGRTVYFIAGTGEVTVRTTENQRFVI